MLMLYFWFVEKYCYNLMLFHHGLISQLYFIICFMILITPFLFVGLYHNLNKPAVGCQHNILWISKWLLETNSELKQAHQKKVSFFSSWSKLAPDWTYAPNGSGSIHRRHHHHHHHHHDWLAEENSLVRCLYWMARYLGQNTTTCIQN